nr:acylneuraminate cytidylyltransferase family protein [uncultured Caldimonas sp.]
MNRICTICARGGSKGVKGKNLRPLGGLPLLAHSIRQARLSGAFDTIAVSSDSAEILQAALDHGADLIIERPPELATDTAAKLPAIRHCVAEAEKQVGHEFDFCVDLDATSPLRSVDDIREVVSLLEMEDSSNVITAAPARRSPYFNLVELDEQGRVTLSKPVSPPFVRRQDAPRCFDMNASIYGWRRATLFASTSLFLPQTKLHVMPEERSLDIDSELDFEIVEFLMARNGQRPTTEMT